MAVDMDQAKLVCEMEIEEGEHVGAMVKLGRLPLIERESVPGHFNRRWGFLRE